MLSRTVRKLAHVSWYGEFAYKRTFNELKRVADIQSRLPSEALRLRTIELLDTLRVDETSSMNIFDVVGFVRGVATAGLTLNDRLAQVALHHLKDHMSSAYGNASVNMIIMCVSIPGKNTDFKQAAVEHAMKCIQTLTPQELVRLMRRLKDQKINHTELVASIADHTLMSISSFTPPELSIILSLVVEFGCINKDLCRETERLVLSGLYSFRKPEVDLIIRAFRTAKIPILNLQLFANNMPSAPPPAVPSSKTPPLVATRPSVTSSPIVNIEPSTTKEGEMTLTQKANLEQKFIDILPTLPLEEIVTVLAGARQKGLDSENIMQVACESISKKVSKITKVDSLIVEDLVLVLAKVNLSTKLAYTIEDTLEELFTKSEVNIRNPFNESRVAVRQINAINDAVFRFPRLAVTPLAKAMLSFLSTIGEVIERSLDSQNAKVNWELLPAYAFRVVTFLVACNAINALDSNRKGICMALQGLPPSRAASLIPVVVNLKSENDPTEEREPLNRFIISKLSAVLEERGVESLNHPLACATIKGIIQSGADRAGLVIRLHDIITVNMRRSLDSVLGIKFDASDSIYAIGAMIDLYSSRKASNLYKRIKFGVIDIVNIVARAPDSSLNVLIEGFRIMSVLVTCEAERSWSKKVLDDVKAKEDADMEPLAKEFRKDLPKLHFRQTLYASDESRLLIEGLARKLRAGIKNASAAETVSVLQSLARLRNVPQLQNMLLIQELPIQAVHHATAVLSSAPPNVISDVITATAQMMLAPTIIGPFQAVCAKALTESLDKEGINPGAWSSETSLAYAKAAYALTIHVGDQVLSSRFGKVLWEHGKELFHVDLKAGDDVSKFAYVVSLSVMNGNLKLDEATVKRFESIALHWAERCTSDVLITFTTTLINLGYSKDSTNPMYPYVLGKRIRILENSQAMSMINTYGIASWVAKPDAPSVANADDNSDKTLDPADIQALLSEFQSMQQPNVRFVDAPKVESKDKKKQKKPKSDDEEDEVNEDDNVEFDDETDGKRDRRQKKKSFSKTPKLKVNNKFPTKVAKR